MQITFVGPGNTVGSPVFCPRCGTPFGFGAHVVMTAPELELWEQFAKKHNLPSVEFAKEVFVMWDPKNPKTPTFDAHLTNLMEDEE